MLGLKNILAERGINPSYQRLKILEYLSCGLPVVSTSIGAEGIDVKNGVNILIENDLEHFALHIINLLSDKAFALSIGEQARALASKYDWKRIISELEHDYGTIISKTLS